MNGWSLVTLVVLTEREVGRERKIATKQSRRKKKEHTHRERERKEKEEEKVMGRAKTERKTRALSCFEEVQGQKNTQHDEKDMRRALPC